MNKQYKIPLSKSQIKMIKEIKKHRPSQQEETTMWANTLKPNTFYQEGGAGDDCQPPSSVQEKWEKEIAEIIENMFVLKGYSVVKWTGGKELKEVRIVKSFIKALLKSSIQQAITKAEKRMIEIIEKEMHLACDNPTCRENPIWKDVKKKLQNHSKQV